MRLIPLVVANVQVFSLPSGFLFLRRVQRGYISYIPFRMYRGFPRSVLGRCRSARRCGYLGLIAWYGGLLRYARGKRNIGFPPKLAWNRDQGFGDTEKWSCNGWLRC